jgi:hypothetical protein
MSAVCFSSLGELHAVFCVRVAQNILSVSYQPSYLSVFICWGKSSTPLSSQPSPSYQMQAQDTGAMLGGDGLPSCIFPAVIPKRRKWAHASKPRISRLHTQRRYSSFKGTRTDSRTWQPTRQRSRGMKVCVGCLTTVPTNSPESTLYVVSDLDGKATVSALKNDEVFDGPVQQSPTGKAVYVLRASHSARRRAEVTRGKCEAGYTFGSGSLAGIGATMNSPMSSGLLPQE